MNLSLVVLAAGMGSRYGGLKQLDQLGPNGETLMDYSIYDAVRAGFTKIVFVIKKSIEDDFKKYVLSKLENKSFEVSYVFQELEKIPKGFTIPEGREKPWGTGHALLMTEEEVDGAFAVINADDFYGANAYKVLADFLKSNSSEYALVGYPLGKTLSDFGFVSRGVCEVDKDFYLNTISEKTKIERKDGLIISDEGGNSTKLMDSDTVSMNLFGFQKDFFSYLKEELELFLKEKGKELKSEFFIPLVANKLVQLNEKKIKVLPTKDSWFGVTYKEDRDNAVATIRDLIKKGVYPDKLW